MLHAMMMEASHHGSGNGSMTLVLAQEDNERLPIMVPLKNGTFWLLGTIEQAYEFIESLKAGIQIAIDAKELREEVLPSYTPDDECDYPF